MDFNHLKLNSCVYYKQHFASQDVNNWCFYQLFGLSFWRHPFTCRAVLRHWWKDTVSSGSVRLCNTDWESWKAVLVRNHTIISCYVWNNVAIVYILMLFYELCNCNFLFALGLKMSLAGVKTWRHKTYRVSLKCWWFLILEFSYQ